MASFVKSIFSICSLTPRSLAWSSSAGPAELHAIHQQVGVITAESSLFRNVITPDLSEGLREQSLQVWAQKTTDGLGTRAELVQKSYELTPETLVGNGAGLSG